MISIGITRGDDCAITVPLDPALAGFKADLTARPGVDKDPVALHATTTVRPDGNACFTLKHQQTSLLAPGRLVADIQLTSPPKKGSRDIVITSMWPEGNPQGNPRFQIIVYADITRN